jgi:hypothetical protein
MAPNLSARLAFCLVLAAMLVLGACDSIQIGGGPTSLSNSYGYRGSNVGGGGRKISAMGESADICECWVQHVEQYEAAVLADSQGVPTKKALMGPDFTTCYSAARPGLMATMPDTAISNLGAAMPSGKRSTVSLFTAVRAGGGRMHVEFQKSGMAWLHSDKEPSGAPIGATSELGRRTGDVGFAFMGAMQTSQSCATFGYSNAMQYYVSAHHGGGSLDLATEREGAKRLLAATHAADALAASSMGLLASIESAASGKGDLKSLDATIKGLAAALPVTATAPTDEEVDGMFALGKVQADVFEQHLRDWAAEGRAARGMTQASAPAAASGPTLDLPSQVSDAGAVAKGVMGLMHGDVGAVMAGAAVLFPKDSSVRTGLEGASAVLHGDVRGAIHAAAKLAPKDSKIAAVLGTVDQVMLATRGSG